jgi:hypothetical protein
MFVVMDASLFCLYAPSQGVFLAIVRNVPPHSSLALFLQSNAGAHLLLKAGAQRTL